MRDSLHSMPKPVARSECLVVAFPLQRRIGKILHVAEQIGEALERQLERLGITVDERNRHMTNSGKRSRSKWRAAIGALREIQRLKNCRPFTLASTLCEK
jgi:hypothetical protein